LDVLSRPDRPTALVCYFAIFVPAVLWAANELGLRIPRDLSLVTFAAEDFREQGVVASSLLEPHYRMGQEAVRSLRAKIEQPLEVSKSRLLDFEWRDMGTFVAPPPETAATANAAS